MVSHIRQAIAKQLVQASGMGRPAIGNQGSRQLDVDQLAWCVRVSAVNKHSQPTMPQMCVPFKLLGMCDALQPTGKQRQMEWASQVASQVPINQLVRRVGVTENFLHVEVDSAHLSQAVLGDIVQQQSKYGLLSDLHKFTHNENHTLSKEKQDQTVVVEFSSPNIAKPFHAGHLRSTILGNFVANINEALGHRVHRINYLGDWGTQFGLLGVGFHKYGSYKELQSNAMQHLFQVYVKINKDVDYHPGNHGDSDSSHSPVYLQALDFFRKMERGDEEALSLWQTCRQCSIAEYEKVYQRLGVQFDAYHGESMYHQAAHNVIQDLKDKALLLVDRDSGVGYVDVTKPGSTVPMKAKVLKSDGTTLYLTRDMAAIIDRYEKFQFDKIHYVVENGQHLHFEQLLSAVHKMGPPWTHIPTEQVHVKFGRVQGMSTRKGEVVFLNDILNEAQARMIDVMKSTATTKETEDIEGVADTLGTSAIVVQDLKEKRLNNYKFSWDRMLHFKGDTGVFLQYAHARLCSLERTSGVDLDVTCDLTSLTEPEAWRLIMHLARFDEAIHRSYSELEPCHVVQYLFQLGHLANLANKSLKVKGQPAEIAKARLLLFHCSKITLANGLKLVGVSPLERM